MRRLLLIIGCYACSLLPAQALEVIARLEPFVSAIQTSDDYLLCSFFDRVTTDNEYVFFKKDFTGDLEDALLRHDAYRVFSAVLYRDSLYVYEENPAYGGDLLVYRVTDPRTPQLVQRLPNGKTQPLFLSDRLAVIVYPHEPAKFYARQPDGSLVFLRESEFPDRYYPSLILDEKRILASGYETLLNILTLQEDYSFSSRVLSLGNRYYTGYSDCLPGIRQVHALGEGLVILTRFSCFDVLNPPSPDFPLPLISNVPPVWEEMTEGLLLLENVEQASPTIVKPQLTPDLRERPIEDFAVYRNYILTHQPDPETNRSGTLCIWERNGDTLSLTEQVATDSHLRLCVDGDRLYAGGEGLTVYDLSTLQTSHHDEWFALN